MKKKKVTIVSIIEKYLCKNGESRSKDIFNHVKEKRESTTENSVYVTLHTNPDKFVRKGYGVWDLKEGCLYEKKERLLRKLILLNGHYQKKLKEIGANGDTRLAGVDFTEQEKEIMKIIYKKYMEEKK